MSVLNFSNLGIAFGERILFENASFEISEKDTVGIIGANGVGKTTLFKIITGECDEYTGNIVKSKETVVGYMQQHACDGSMLCVYDEAMSIFENLKTIEIRLEQLSKEIQKQPDNMDKLIDEQLRLTEKYQSSGGLTYKSRVKATLIGLGFSKDDFYLPVEKLSGGQKSKLSLCKLLLSGADLLLLDEPTNHLDIESVEWLEDFIRDFKGTCLIISHDRYFLDKLTNKTVEIENKRITIRKGNYSTFLELKKHEEESVRRNYENTMAEVRRIEGIITQQKQWNRERNIKTAQSKQKMIDRLTKNLVKPDQTKEEMHFSFFTRAETGNDVLIAENLSKSFDNKLLFKDVDLDIKKRERVFFLGANGSGKTTLLRILIGEEKADSGFFKFGANVKIGYFDQTLRGLNTSKSIIDEIRDEQKNMTMTEIRNALARFMFFGDDVYKKMCDLSGGEKARIALLKLMLTSSNVLLLDEPTNHLDIKSREALEEALSEFDGTLIMISHDRYFINKLASSIIRVSADGAKKFDGGYDDYCNKIILSNSDNKNFKEQEPKINDYKLRKEKESRKRKLSTKISKTEELINQNEIDIKNKEDEISNIEDASDYEQIIKLTQELELLKNESESLMLEWEMLNEEISEYE